MTPPDGHLVAALRRSAGALVKRNICDVEDVLTQIVAAAAQTVPGADSGGLSRTDRGSLHAHHATDEVVRELDQLQYELHQGPCVEAATDPPPSGVVTAHDLAGRPDSDRWPRFAPTAVRLGYRSVLSAQLSLNAGGRHAALNLYAHRPNAFDEHAAIAAGMFATQASLILYGAERAAHLERALDTRDVIGQAKGILMERFKINGDEAFEMLITSSQSTNLKLVAVAQWLAREANSPQSSLDDGEIHDPGVASGNAAVPPTLRVV